MSVCRLCAAVVAECTSIFSRRQEKTVAEMVLQVASVAIPVDDPHSTLVCPDCIELTLDAFNYVERVRETEHRFKEELRPAEEMVEYVESENEAEQVEVLDVMDAEGVELTEHKDTQIEAETFDVLLDLEDETMEVLEGDPEDVSRELFSLFVESIHKEGSEKWYKLRRDPDFTDVLSNTLLDLLEEEESLDEEEPSDEDGQIARCCNSNCKMVFRSRKELVGHGPKTHKAERFQDSSSFECHVCYQRFETRQALLTHLRRLIRDYRCQFCGVYFNSPADKTVHVNTSHVESKTTTRRTRIEEQPVKICCGCEATFESMEELFQHGVDVHQSQQPPNENLDREHQCNICFKYFKNKSGVRTHQVLVYKPKAYSCGTCGKAFECASKLSTHETIHITERNYACETCGGTFRTAADLRGHQRVHQERNLVCSTCGARFHKPAHLRSHLKTHDANAYEYTCSFCSKQFKEKSNWKVHLKVHTGEKQYQCQFCTKVFRYATDRKRHEMSHTGNYPHGCKICGKAFARPVQLQSHIRVCEKREK
ncbi:zinc finger protein 557-like [Culex pipiens pallens]|uniref:zinc finger protein 557-like n=1 Tax=Culex pipiens pallens TaxID=42434 RepID=UPI001954B82B|nr:zinc finger protein 557-like [Culex pipiens pallens]